MIDVKELHIGSHASLKGERITIFQTIYTGLVEVLRPNKEFEVCTTSNELDPIPITPELLEELGFEKINEYGACSEWKRGDIQILIYGERVELFIFACIHVLSIRYLHELESIVYLTTKQKLIKD